jgi:hypothetical protein
MNFNKNVKLIIKKLKNLIEESLKKSADNTMKNTISLEKKINYAFFQLQYYTQ